MPRAFEKFFIRRGNVQPVSTATKEGMGTHIRVDSDNTVQNTRAQSIIYIDIEVIMSLSDVRDVYDEGGITIPVVLLN